MKTYKELEVWQRATELVVSTYELTRTFPADEKFGLTQQIRKASVSVAANIAEGWGRNSTREYIQFLTIARGSLMELETHFILSAKLGYTEQHSLDAVSKEIKSVGMMLNRLIKSLQKS